MPELQTGNNKGRYKIAISRVFDRNTLSCQEEH